MVLFLVFVLVLRKQALNTSPVYIEWSLYYALQQSITL